VLLRGRDLALTIEPERGMRWASLLHDGRELLTSYGPESQSGGVPLMHPWANRLAATTYELAGRRGILEPDDDGWMRDAAGLPLHGYPARAGAWSPARLEERPGLARASATLTWDGEHELRAFPFPHRLEVTVELRDSTIEVTTVLRADLGVAVPVCFGWHPFFQLPEVPAADWRIEAPVTVELELDGRHLPTGRRQAAQPPTGGVFHGLWAAGDGTTFRLFGGGREIALTLVSGYPLVQLWSPREAAIVAFEPMTAPGNALIDARELDVVPAGSSYEAVFRVTCR